MTDETVGSVDDDVVDAVTAVVADELSAQMGVRRALREIPEMIAYEVVRGFEVRSEWVVGDKPEPPVDMPVVRHVTVDRHDRAHIELASLGQHAEGDEVTFDLPIGGRISVRVAKDGTVAEIALSPASQLLPRDVWDENPQPTAAVDVPGGISRAITRRRLPR